MYVSACARFVCAFGREWHGAWPATGGAPRTSMASRRAGEYRHTTTPKLNLELARGDCAAAKADLPRKRVRLNLCSMPAHDFSTTGSVSSP